MFKPFININVDVSTLVSDSIRQECETNNRYDGTTMLHPHKHPRLHVARKILEAKVVELCWGLAGGGPGLRIIDVGGNPRTHVDRDSLVHSMQPDMAGKKKLAALNYCTNAIGLDSEIDCLACQDVDVSMSIHSLYYLEPASFYSFLRSQRLVLHVAVLHDFSIPIPNHLVEEVVTCDIDVNSIRMVVRGNKKAYTHPNPAKWFDKPFYTGEGFAFSLSKCFAFEWQQVLLITAMPIIVQPIMLPLDPIEVLHTVADQVALTIDTSDFKNFSTFIGRFRNFLDNKDPKLGIWFRENSTADLCLELFYGRANDRLRRFGRFHGVDARGNVLLTSEMMKLSAHSMTSMVGRLKLNYYRWKFGVLTTSSFLPRVKTLVRSILCCVFLYFLLFILRNFRILVNRLVNVFKQPFSVYYSDKVQAYVVEDTCDYVLHYPIAKYSKIDSKVDECGCEAKLAGYNWMYHIQWFTPNYPRRCYHGVYAALTNRVLNQRVCDVSLWAEMPMFMFNGLKDYISMCHTIVDFDDWVSRFPPQKREELNQAFGVFALREFDPHLLNRTKGFIKNEMGSKYHVQAPRFISSRDPLYDSAVGPEVYSYQKMISEYYDSDSNIFFTTGASNEDKAKWVIERHDVGMYLYENDFSKFDSTITPEAIAYMCRLYTYLGVHPSVVDLLKLQMRAFGVVASAKVRYSTTGTMPSGVPNTTLSNTLTNIVAHIYAIDVDFHMMVMGDDCVIATHRPINLEETVQGFSDLGFVAKMRLVTIEDLEFCSCVLYPVMDGYVFGPKIGRILARLCWCIDNVPLKDRAERITSVFTGMFSQAHFVPLLSQFLGRFAKQQYGYVKHKNYCKHPHVASLETWQFVSRRYELDLDDLLDLAIELSSFKPPFISKHPALRVILDVDFYIDPLSFLTSSIRGFNWLHVVVILFISPVLEEVLKRFGIIPVFIIALLESGFLLFDFVVRFLVHYSLSNCPLHYAILLHSLLNLIVLLVNYFVGNENIIFSLLMPKLLKKKPSNKKQQKKKREVMSVPTVGSAIKSAVKAALIGAGSAGGTYLGGPAGGAMGGKMGAYLSKITGCGDYKVKDNSVFNGNPIASFSNGNRRTLIRHREFVTDVNGSTVFQLSSYAINPTNKALFPWLSGVADLYTQFRFHGLVFEFISSSGNATGSNTALGTVVMGTNYNVNLPDPTNKIALEQMEFTISTTPATNAIHPCECAVGEQVCENLYCDTTTGDLRFSRMGNFLIAKQGMQQVNVVGELWVSYEVELLKPNYAPTASLAYSFTDQPVEYATAVGVPTFQNIFNDCPKISKNLNWGPIAPFSQNTYNDTFTFGDDVSSGYVVFEVYVFATTTGTAGLPTYVISPGVATIGTSAGPWGANPYFSTAAGDNCAMPNSFVVGNSWYYSVIFKITAAGNKYVRFVGGTIPLGPSTLVKIRYLRGSWTA